MIYNISFTEKELSILDVALRKRPYEEVVELFRKINQQIKEQLNPPTQEQK